MTTEGLPEGSLIRFGAYEFDPTSGELRKAGMAVHLSPQPARVLALLAGRAGQVVTREVIREKIWGSETYVDFEQGLNHCIKQIRTALCDDVGSPRYIQTLPRLGYRFIAEVEVTSPVEAAPPPAGGTPEAAGTSRPRLRWWLVSAVLGVAATAVVLLTGTGRLRERLLASREASRITSIAVLPLENLSGDSQEEYFADGMTEELITALGNIRGLRVISRTSVMRYKGTAKPVPQIGRELNVDAVIEGSVTQSGGRLRLTANLIHAPSDRHLWAGAYDADLKDILALRRELARTIARQVRATLPHEDRPRLAGARTVNPEAHEMYLKGQYHYYKWRREEFQKAIVYFERAIQIDPNYAEAYLGLAKTYGWQWMVDALTPDEAYPKFSAALKRALEIDDTVPEAHYVQAVAAWYFYWNWAQAEAEFKRALELNPNLEEARYEYAWFLSTMGRLAEAVAEAERAVSGDPLSAAANLALGSVYQCAGRLDEALAQLRKTIELEPYDPRCYEFLGVVYRSLGLYDEMVEARRKELTLRGVPAEVVDSMLDAYRSGGFPGYLRWSLQRTRNPYRAAVLQAGLGMKDEAFASLEKAYQAHRWEMVRLNLPEWAPLRSDPRFQELFRRMNFPSQAP